MQGPATCESLPSCEAVTCELPCLCEAKSEAGWSRPTPWRLRGGREKAVLPMAFGYQCLPRGSCACPWGLCTKRPAQGLFCSAVQSDLVGEERSCLLSSKSYCSGKRRRLVACLCTSALIFIICGPPHTTAQNTGLQTVNAQIFSLTQGFSASFQVEAPRVVIDPKPS